MQNKLYVGNLSYGSTGDDLNQLFNQYGTITEAKVISDKYTGRSKGFGFVTFDNDDAAQKALAANETEFQGRKLKVNIAREEDRSRDRDRQGGGGSSRGGFRGGDRGDKRW